MDQMLATLVEAEWEEQENRKTDRLIKNAGFRYPASLEEIDYSHPRNLDRNQVLRLVDCNYLERAENVLVTGAQRAAELPGWCCHKLFLQQRSANKIDG
ncbi:ATP-binding protein [Proteiniphilum saccharofermentans]|uniref:ATP-binding protein n=1 Tax=Proteiniphilum saccharofermentans TaxID=1642647 RepID=UPI001E6439A1|nr:ATP-binding protein [Proteiniphilum saccharofermentans]